jgi:hypothetical protein
MTPQISREGNTVQGISSSRPSGTGDDRGLRDRLRYGPASALTVKVDPPDAGTTQAPRAHTTHWSVALSLGQRMRLEHSPPGDLV